MIKNKLRHLEISLPIYVALIIAVTLVITLISLGIFWQSPTRQLAVDLQQLTDENLDDPEALNTSNQVLDLKDGQLTTADIEYFKTEIEKLKSQLQPESDFQLHQPDIIYSLLEF